MGREKHIICFGKMQSMVICCDYNTRIGCHASARLCCPTRTVPAHDVTGIDTHTLAC